MLHAKQVGVRFTFKHEEKWMEMGHQTPVKRPVTFCFLQAPNGQQYTGEAVTHPNDKFLKETGRKLSLARALKESGLDYESRKVVWDAYFSR